jgi:quercetin dioxygenase-like cupin family protein
VPNYRNDVLGNIEGKAYWFLDQLVVIKFPTDAVPVNVGITEITTPEGSGPPPHIHSREDEIFYILEGRYDVMLGNERLEAQAGTWIFGPRGQAHGYTVRSSIGKHLSLTVPSGFERLFEAVGRPAPTRTLPEKTELLDAASLGAVAATFGVTLLPPK